MREAFSQEEVYAFDEDSDIEDYFEAGIFSEKTSPQNIFSIICSLFLGNNLTAELSPIDLEQIEGELVLSNHEIVDLDGIQHYADLPPRSSSTCSPNTINPIDHAPLNTPKLSET